MKARTCTVCGRGQVPRLGGLAPYTIALRALGYKTGSYAHLACLNRARRLLRADTRRALQGGSDA